MIKMKKIPGDLANLLSPKKLLIRTSKILIGFSLILHCLPDSANAQNRVTINRAKEVIGVTVEGERVRKLLGDVSLKTENMVMYCDSAYQYLEKNEVRAFGNIEIETPDELIFADTLVYFTDVDFSQLRGRVVIEADSATLFSEAVDYRFSTKVGHFLEKVRLEDPDGILTAQSGFYYREADSAVFRGDVQLSDSLQYVEGDSLFINRKKNTYRLYGDLFVDDRENNVMLKGDSLKSDSVGHRLLEGNAWLKKYKEKTDTTAIDSTMADTSRVPPISADTTAHDSAEASYQRQRQMAMDTSVGKPDSVATSQPPDSSSSDTTHIRAQKIHSIEKTTPADTQAVINAYHNVRIWSPKFAAIADTAHYDDQTETFVLRSNPIAWHKQIQLTGPYIKVQLKNDEINRLISHVRPFVVQQDTSIDRLNQVTGDTLRVNFTNGEISRIHVYPNSHLLRFTKNENGEADGLVDMTAPSTTLLFEGGELDTMKALGPVDGFYLPKGEKTAERRLDGFVWSPEKRPKKPTQPMEPRLPPIPEEPPFQLPKRYLNAQKE